MIKHISQKIKRDDDAENENIILQGIKRNFGGSNFENVIQTLESTLQFRNSKEVASISSDVLIKDNLSDFDSRHSMIITDNQENTMQFI